jgi:CBS domain-containing protein
MKVQTGQIWNIREDEGYGMRMGAKPGLRLDSQARSGMGAGIRPRRLRVGEIMRRQVARARPEDTLQAAARLFRDEELSLLPICAGEILVGLVTERDLVIRAMALGSNPAATLLQEVMTSNFFFCFEDQDCAAARQLMLENHVQRMPVTDSSKRLVGMVRLEDLQR